jgi:hypothetical protein
MTRVRSLLLGSAAGVVAVAGAQAADLPVKAKPVEYVKICSLYGDGFYYIPGTETCVRIGASAQADYFYNTLGNGHPHYDAANGAQDRTVSAHAMRGRADIGLDSRSQTAYGTLRSFVVLRMDNVDGGTVTPNVPRAFIQWAGFTFGHTKSFTDPVASWGGGADFKNLTQGQIHADTGANGTNQIAYSWELGNGMVLVFGANERRSNALANLSNAATVTVGSPVVSSRAGMNHPDPYVAWRGSQAWGSWSAAVIAVDNNALYYTGNNPVLGAVPCPAPAQVGTTQCAYPSDKWGFAWLSGIEFKLPWIAQGDRIGGFFNYGQGSGNHTGGVNIAGGAGLFQGGNNVALGVKTDGVYVNGSALQLTTSWSFGGAYEHYWAPNLSTTVYAGRSSIEYNDTVINSRVFCGGSGAAVQRIVVAATTRCDPGFKLWQMGVHTDWYPVPGFRLGAEVGYTFVETAFDGQLVTLTATQGARPTGVYLAKDAGIASVALRAQRGFGGIGE